MMFERGKLSSFQGAKDERGPVLLSETYPNDVAFSLGEYYVFTSRKLDGQFGRWTYDVGLVASRFGAST